MSLLGLLRLLKGGLRDVLDNTSISRLLGILSTFILVEWNCIIRDLGFSPRSRETPFVDYGWALSRGGQGHPIVKVNYHNHG